MQTTILIIGSLLGTVIFIGWLIKMSYKDNGVYCVWTDHVMFYETECGKRIRDNNFLYKKCPFCNLKIRRETKKVEVAR